MSNLEQSHGQILAQSHAATRVLFEWVGQSKTVDGADATDLAQHFEAATTSVKGTKSLYSRKDWPAWDALCQIRQEARKHWVGTTRDYPEASIRLLPRARLDDFESRMHEFERDITSAARTCDREHEGYVESSRSRLGRLWNASDFPGQFESSCKMSVEFPSLEPAAYLMELCPALYQRELDRVRGQFDRAVRMAEEQLAKQFAERLAKLIDRLHDRKFRDADQESLRAWAQGFRELSLGSLPELDRLVEQCAELVGGAHPATVSANGALASNIAASLDAMNAELETLMIVRPGRIIRVDAPAELVPHVA